MNSNSFSYEKKANFKDFPEYEKTININDNIINYHTNISSPEIIKTNFLTNDKNDYLNSYTFSPKNEGSTLSDNHYSGKRKGRNNFNKSTILSQTLSSLNNYYLNLYKKSEKDLNELKRKYYNLEKEKNENKELLEESNKERDEMAEKIDELNAQLDKILNLVKDVNMQKKMLEKKYNDFKENKVMEIKNEYEKKNK